MDRENSRRHERVKTNVRAKWPGDSTWTESTASDVSAGGLFFEAPRQLKVGDFVDLQFMLQSKSGTTSNIHFFASSLVVRVIPKADIYQIVVQFIINDDVRKEILKLIAMIKSQSLKVDRPTTSDSMFRKGKSE